MTRAQEIERAPLTDKELIAKLRDSATWISDTIVSDKTGGWSNLRHLAADRLEQLLARPDRDGVIEACANVVAEVAKGLGQSGAATYAVTERAMVGPWLDAAIDGIRALRITSPAQDERGKISGMGRYDLADEAGDHLKEKP